MKEIHYFAYGSNLHLGQMRSRCPGAEGIAPAVLTGWRLAERGFADVEKVEGACVYGALYRITEEDLAELDFYEGYPFLYTRELVAVTDASGRIWPAVWVYTMTDVYKRRCAGKRYDGNYRAVCSRGAAEWGIPDAFAENPR